MFYVAETDVPFDWRWVREILQAHFTVVPGSVVVLYVPWETGRVLEDLRAEDAAEHFAVAGKQKRMFTKEWLAFGCPSYQIDWSRPFVELNIYKIDLYTNYKNTSKN